MAPVGGSVAFLSFGAFTRARYERRKCLRLYSGRSVGSFGVFVTKRKGDFKDACYAQAQQPTASQVFEIQNPCC